MPGSVTGTTQHPTSRHFARDQSTGHQLRFQAMRIRGLEKESSIGGWFAFLLMVGIVTLAGCVQPKVPWRVVVCEGEKNAQVRIASRIREPDLTAHCASEWKSGFLRVSVRFDGAFDEQLLVRATWFDGGDKIIPLDNTFDRQFSLGSAATRTESWRSPIPKGQRVRLDVSCVRC